MEAEISPHQRRNGDDQAVGAGSSLTGGAKSGNYADITETAKRFIDAIQKARLAPFDEPKTPKPKIVAQAEPRTAGAETSAD